MNIWHVYDQDDEDPSIPLEWLDGNGNTLDLSAATFSVEFVDKATGTVALTKTTGITGAATLPNVTITPATGELAALSGLYDVVVHATVSGRQRTFRKDSPPVIRVKP